MHRHLNWPLIDRRILENGWSFSEAADRFGIHADTLRKVRQGKNVHNDVILKIHKRLGIPLEQLVVWRDDANAKSVQQKKKPRVRMNKRFHGND